MRIPFICTFATDISPCSGAGEDYELSVCCLFGATLEPQKFMKAQTLNKPDERLREAWTRLIRLSRLF